MLSDDEACEEGRMGKRIKGEGRKRVEKGEKGNSGRQSEDVACGKGEGEEEDTRGRGSV